MVHNPAFYSKVVLDSVKSELADGTYYVYAADGLANTQNPDTLNYTVENQHDVINTMIFGKKIIGSEIYKVIDRNTWEANTVYARYDDSDEDLQDKTFFVINSQRAIYKCIDNNDDSKSTVEPTTFDTSPTILSDGYIWQYMYRLTVAQINDLTTDDYIPVVEDSNVTQNSTFGTIDHITISNSGSGYTATSNGIVNQVVSNTIFQIENSASSANGTYVDSSFYIEAGDSIGSISKITAYHSNSSGRFITTEDELPNVSISSEYLITPTVQINGNGNDAVARSLVTSQGLIDSVEMIKRGSDYTYATATIVANSTWGDGATTTISLSPGNGHGSDVPTELFSDKLLVSVGFLGDELETIPDNLKFSTVGIVSNIKEKSNTQVSYSANSFDNTANLEISVVEGEFIVGDTVLLSSNTDVSGKVIGKSNNNINVIYDGYSQFAANDSIVTGDGDAAEIANIANPNVYVFESEVMTMLNTPTLTRSEDNKEIINIIVGTV